MNILMFLAGLWFISFIASIFLFSCIGELDEYDGDGSGIMIACFIISTGITLLVGGLLL